MSAVSKGTIEEFLDKVALAMVQIGHEESTEVFFRGQAQGSWPLDTTLHRFVKRLKERDTPKADRETHLFGVESSLYWEFRTKAISLHKEAKSGWDYLFWARHYGVPTRLMDWTENLFVALYFALIDNPASIAQPRIWLLNPYRLNAHFEGKEELYHPDFISDSDFDELINSEDSWEWEFPVALYPEQTSPRQHAQQGWFTIHGNNEESLEKQQDELMLQNADNEHLPFLTFIDLTDDEVVTLTRLLKLSGRSRFSIYQDLDSLAKDTVARLES